MSTLSAEGISQDLEAQEALVVDNPELERLQAFMEEFNSQEWSFENRVTE